MKEPHPTVLGAKMAGTLVSYISNHKFKFKFNLKIESFKFQKKIINAFLVIYIQKYILYVFQREILHLTISLKVALGPNKIINIKNSKFCLYFCLQYVLSFTIPLYIFDHCFVKIILEVLFMGFYSAKYTCFLIILKQTGCPFPILRLSLCSHF